MKVLVCEDDDCTRIALTHALSRFGASIYEKRTTSAVTETDCDIAIIDLHFSGDYDGNWLAQKIRQENPDCYIVMYTALEYGKHYNQACALADEIVTKRKEVYPFIESLLAKVKLRNARQ